MEDRINELAYNIVGMNNIGTYKKELFDVHNEIYKQGLSKVFVIKRENPMTMCGSCQIRTRNNFWKFYHFEFEQKDGRLEFAGRQGGGKHTHSSDFIPLYKKNV